jgi:hypothetical protein
MPSSASNDEDRSPKWCERCQRYHPWSPPFNEQQLIDKAAQELSDAIDEEILQELLKNPK